MKKLTFSMTFFLLYTLGALCSSILSGCGPGQLFGPTITPSFTPTPTTTFTPTTTPTPTLTPTLTPVPSVPGVLYVAPHKVGNGNCLSWNNACELQIALQKAQEGNEIWVKAGVYKPSRNDVSAAFVLKKGVAVYGGFSGVEFKREQRDWKKNVVILSGDLDNDDINDDGNFIAETTEKIVGNNSWNVVLSNGVDNSAILDGFIITGAVSGGIYNFSSSPILANLTIIGNSSWYDGGGITNYGSSPTLKNVILQGNKAKSGGGMANIDGSNPVLVDVVFLENVAEYNGGGLDHRYSSKLLMENVNFIGNSAQYGGAIALSGSQNITLTNVTFTGNKASIYGGGIFEANCKNVAMTEVNFGENRADHGAALAHFDSDTLLTRVDFDTNTASLNGGAIFNEKGNLTIIGAYFRNNKVTLDSPHMIGGNGGAIWSRDLSKIKIYNALFWKNVAFNGGSAIYNAKNSQLLIVNASFSHHDGTVIENGFQETRLINVIMWDNDLATEIVNWPLFSATTFVAYSNIRGCKATGRWESSCGQNGGYNIDIDPLFVNPEVGDLHLQSNSPCIDAGRNNMLPSSIVIDLDDKPRFVDIPNVTDTGNGEPPIVDMGAYEVQEGAQIR